jgi:hypothetical protein
MNKKLYILITSLSSAQKKVLKVYLNAFAGRGEEGTHLWRLFEILDRKPNMPLEFYSNVVYGKQNINALKRLGSRLYYKVLDSLLIDINVSRLFESAEHNMTMLVLVRKIMLQYYILRLSSKTDAIGISLLYRAKAICETYELYSTHIEVLQHLKAKSSSKNRKSTFDNWDEQIEFLKEAHQSYLRAYDWYNRYQELQNYHGNLSIDKHLNFLNEAIASMQRDYDKYASPTVKYFQGVLKTALLEQESQYQAAINQCKDLLEHLKRHASVHTKARVSIQYSNIAIMEFQLGRLAEALRYNQLSISVSLASSSDMKYKLFQKAEILFYLGELEQSLVVIDDLLPTIADRFELLKAKARILRAAVLFSNKQYKEASAIFGEKVILSSDKAGWELSVRIMRIMTLIELNKTDDAETVYVNLLRYIQRTTHRFEISERYMLIVKVLGFLSKASFVTDHLPEKVDKVLTELLNKPDLAWKYGSSELIAFDAWLESKLRKKRGPKPGQKKKSNA